MPPISSTAIAEPAAVRDFCQRWGKAWNDHDGDAVAALCQRIWCTTNRRSATRCQGRDAIRDFVVMIDASFPDHKFFLEGLYADVARPAVLVAWRFIGTHAPTGRKVEFHGDDRLEFREDGLIGTYRCLYDNDLVLRQLGENRSQ